MFRDVAFLYVRYPVHRIGLRRRLLPYADTYGTMTVIRGGDFLIIYQVVGMYRPSLEIHVWDIVRIPQPSAVEKIHTLKSRIRTLSAGGATTFFLLFFTLVTGPRRSLNLKLSDTRVYAPQIRARLATTAHFCKAVALELTAVPKKQPCASLLTQIRRGGVTLGTDEDTAAFSENHLAVSFQQSTSISFFGE